jgi:glycosyltransferase involved in cell wall biosynthesis
MRANGADNPAVNAKANDASRSAIEGPDMIAEAANRKQPAPLILHAFPTFRVGGSQARFADISRFMGERFRHIVLAMDGGYDCAERIDPAVAIDYWRKFTPPSSLVKLLLHVRGLLRRYKPDVLVTYNWGAIEWALADRLPICPHIHIADGFGPEEASGQLLRRVLTRRVALGPNSRLVVPSQTLEHLALKVWRIPAARVVYIPNGIDMGRFKPAAARQARERLGLPQDRPIVGTLAALRPEKNLGRLIRAFALLSSRLKSHLVIAGEGPERGPLEALVRDRGHADHVSFLGHTLAPETVYPAFDIFALSSDTEQMPCSVLEAMACGLPVAAVDVGDVKAMVSDQNRRFIVTADDARLSQALLSVLRDPGSASNVGEANRAKVVGHYDIAWMCAAHASLLQQMIEIRRPSA